MNHLSKAADRERLVQEAVSADEPAITELHGLAASFLVLANKIPKPIQLERGIATIPLKGIDVPFHSTHLRAGVQSYRKFLQQRILESNIHPERLVGKFVPNIMAQPFSLEEQYVKEACKLTQSPVLKEMLQKASVY